MNRIGIVALRQRVASAAEKYDLKLTIAGDPVPPHQVKLGVLPITSRGSSTVVAREFERWIDGYATADAKE